MNQQIKNPQQIGVSPTTGTPQRQGHYPNEQRPMQPSEGVHQTQSSVGQRTPQQGGRAMNQPNRPMQQNPYPPQAGRAQRPMPNRPTMPQQGHPMNRPAQRPTGMNAQQRPAMSHQPMAHPQQPINQNPKQVLTQPQQQVQGQSQNQQTQPSRSKYVPNFASDYGLPPFIITTKGIVLLFVVTLILGMIFGSSIFGSSAPKQAPRGLQGVVNNDDISPQTRKNLRRCGLVVRGQECVLYIMNSTRYDKSAKDFFDDAVRLMGIQRYSIDLVNPRYATRLIPPGRFAEIYIPPLR